MNFAQKYRPTVFDDVMGQDAIVRVLRAVVLKREYESAYMFSGATGTGKTTLGRIFAKSVLCEDPVDGNPCCRCESCLLFEQEKHFGFREMDAATVGSKEDMIRLRDEAAFHPISKKKIILLDECHDISKAGQDSLLKQVEQCPDHLIYIFCTTNPEKVDRTLYGRCLQFQVLLVASELIAKRLKKICELERLEYDDAALHYLAERSNGHMRDAINALQEASYVGPITIENLKSIFHDCDEDVFKILSNIGREPKESLDACRRVLSFVSVSELYNAIIRMLVDTSKLFFDYRDFHPVRLSYLEKLKDLYGYSILSLLDYLLNRDRYVDRTSVECDIVLLHHKLHLNRFENIFLLSKQESFPNVATTAVEKSQTVLTHAELAKMSVCERSRILRRQRMSQKTESKEKERVPYEWPLPKEDRVGESTLNEAELSPEEFSRLLVGGRGGVE